MTPIDRAVRICGKQSELARRVTGKPATGYVYHWRTNGVTAQIAAGIENAVRAAIAESEECAAVAAKLGGPVRAEELLPDASVRWIRGESGFITAYEKQLTPVELEGTAHAH